MKMNNKKTRLDLYKKELRKQYYLLILIPIIALITYYFSDMHYGLAVSLGLIVVTPLVSLYNYCIAIRHKLVMVHMSDKPYHKKEHPFVYYSMLILFLVIGLGLIAVIASLYMLATN
ncbi:hypothetical protein KS2013_1604 [Kangiella sediminilitoris]|uniref:Uncharacterized protein n=1 Tax=Kangiella sediminilitoris TaxID=1144748 RepID=A0A1B3BBY6_9GAMM|nr:hypothetical protein KS2013_1604 [Kangiella sediminilitoris]